MIRYGYEFPDPTDADIARARDMPAYARTRERIRLNAEIDAWESGTKSDVGRPAGGARYALDMVAARTKLLTQLAAIEIATDAEKGAPTGMNTSRHQVLRKKVKAKYLDASDLDEHVHEAKGHEASSINNQGVEAQFEYLAEALGLDWIEEALLNEES